MPDTIDLVIPDAEELTTLQLNGFSRHVRRHKAPEIEDYLHAPRLEACTVAIQAAIDAGWFGGSGSRLKPRDVEDYPPAEIVRVGWAIMEVYYAAQRAASAAVEKK